MLGSRLSGGHRAKTDAAGHSRRNVLLSVPGERLGTQGLDLELGMQGLRFLRFHVA